MKRLVLGIMTCLLLGVLINLAVTWSLALTVDPLADKRSGIRERIAMIPGVVDRIVGVAAPSPEEDLRRLRRALENNQDGVQHARGTPEYEGLRGLVIDLDSKDRALRRAARAALERVARSSSDGPAAIAAGALADERLAWVVRHDGTFVIDETRPGRPVVELLFRPYPGYISSPDPLITELERLAEFPELEVFDLPRRGITDGDLKPLRHLRSLRSLGLSRTAIRGDGLAHLEPLDRLVEIDLSGSRELTDDGLAGLSSLVELEAVDLSDCRQLTGAGLVHLETLPNLRSLDLSSTSRSSPSTFGGGMRQDGWARALRRMRSRRYRGDELARRRSGLSDDTAVHLADLTGLRVLAMRRTRITDAGLAHLDDLPHLETLDLMMTAVTDASVERIAAHTGLRSLDLGLTFVGDAGVRHLGALENLEHLSLRGTGVTKAGLTHLRPLRRLRTLDLWQSDVHGMTVDDIATIRELERLTIDGGSIAFRDVPALASDLPRLTLASALANAGYGAVDANGRIALLDMTERDVTSDDLIHVAPLRELQALRLYGTAVTDDGLRHLTALTDLAELGLSPAITDTGLDHLTPLTGLRRLHRGGSQVTFAGLHALLVERQGRSFGDFLQVAGLRVRAEHGGAWINAPRLDVGDKHMVEIVKIPDLEALHLGASAVTDRSAARLTTLDRLRSLWLSGPSITGATLKALRGCAELRVLWIPETAITSDDLAHLAALPHLEVLNIAGAPIDDRALEHLARLPTLRTLVVDCSALSDDAIDRLAAHRPTLDIVQSQRRALAAIRGRERVLAHMTQGRSPKEQSGGVRTYFTTNPELRGPFGDEHFEVARGVDLSTPEQAERLEHLAILATVEQVFASGAGADPALRFLPPFPELRQLWLQQADISDESFAHVAELTRLEELLLSDVEISDDALRSLAGLRNLRSLRVRSVAVDSGLRHIEGLENLKRLDLFRVDVSDETLEHFHGLTQLDELTLEQTPNVTAAGIAALVEALPDTDIEVDALPTDPAE